MNVSKRLALAVVAVLTAASVGLPSPSPAAGSLITAADPVAMTLYLHGTTPAGNVDEVPDFAGATDPQIAPFMDENPPATPLPKIGIASAGNPDFRKNVLLPYWSTPVHGNVSDVSVTLNVAIATAADVTATLFGDGGVGSGGVIGRGSASALRGTSAVAIAISGIDAAVDKELVLQVDISGNAGGTVLYDSSVAASSISFVLGPYNPAPPEPLPNASAGWNSLTAVHLTKAQRESSLALSPTDPNLLMMCDPSGVPATGEGHSYFYRSTNNGASWHELNVETDPNDTRQHAYEGGDCDVAFDAGGVAYSADTWLGDLSVGASTDGGNTWSGTAFAASGPVVDRPWLVGGSSAGTVHISYQDVQFAMPSVIWYTRSTDFGKTFSPAVPVATANADGGFSWQGNFVITPDQQNLYLVYTRRQDPVYALDESGAETVWVAASHDAGLTWTSKPAAVMPHSASYLYPSIGLDAGGMLHIVFSSATDVDHPIWYTHSTDGVSWSTPEKILSGVAGYSPWVVGGAAGEAAIQWYGSPDPLATTATESDWYFYWARVKNAGTPSQTISAGPTTVSPIFHGTQGETPEFNQVRLDANGKMRIGASAMHMTGSQQAWAVFYQAEQ